MRKRKVALVLLAIGCVYVVAAGGIGPLIQAPEGFLSALMKPLAQIRPFDAGLLMMAAVFLVWVLLLGETGQGISRETLLVGVGLGSALLTTMFLGLLLMGQPGDPKRAMTGILALMALLQGFVGLTAGVLLTCRRESRRMSPLPLALNGVLTGVTIYLVCTPLMSTALEG